MRYLWLILISITLIIGCSSPPDDDVEYSSVPYPANKNILFYQSEADSGYQPFWTDIKGTVSAYLNNSEYDSIDVKPEDVILLGQGLYRGTVEVEMPRFILVLKLERPNKSLGDKSIWQVISKEEKPWPDNRSRSTTSK
jgi:hypothetical protein